MARYRGLARDTGLWLSLGGFQETGPDAGHTHNTHVVLDARGDTAAAYRKARTFCVCHRLQVAGRKHGSQATLKGANSSCGQMTHCLLLVSAQPGYW